MANYLYKPITEMPGNSGKSSSASAMTRFKINKRQRIRKDGDGGLPPTTPTPKPLAPSTPPKSNPSLSNPSTGPMRAAAEGQLRSQPAPTLREQVPNLPPPRTGNNGNYLQANATRTANNGNYLQANATPTPPSSYNPNVWNENTQSSPGMQTIKTPQNAWSDNLNNKAVQDSYMAMGFPMGGQAQMANQNGYLVGQVGNPMENPPSAISLSQYKPGYGRGGTYKSMKKSQGAKMSNMRKGISWGKIVSGALDAGSDAGYAARAMARAARSPEVRAAVVDAARGVKAGAKQVGSTMGEAVRNRRVARTPEIVEVLTEAPKKTRVRSSGKAGAPPVVTPTGGFGSELGASDVDVGSFDRNARTRPQLFLSGLYGKLVGLPNERLAAYRGARATAAGKAAADAKELQRKLVRDALVHRKAARSWEAKRIGHETDRTAALTAAAKTGSEAAESAARFYPKARNALAAAGLIGGTALGAKYYFGKRMNKGLRKGNSEGSKKMNGSALAAMLMNTGRGTAEGIQNGGYEAQSIGPKEQTRLLNMLMQMQTMLVRDPENPNMYPAKKPNSPRKPYSPAPQEMRDPENPNYVQFKKPTPSRIAPSQANTNKRFSKAMNPSALAAMLMATGRGTAEGIRYGGYEGASTGPRMQDQRLRMLMQRGGMVRDPENAQYIPLPTMTRTPTRRPTTTPQARIDPANPYYMPYATMTRTPTATPRPNTSKRMSKSISNIQQGSAKHVVGGYRGAMGKSFYKSAAARPTQATKNHRSSKFGI